MKLLHAFSLLALMGMVYGQSKCDLCLGNGATCLSETEYKVCVNNKTMGDVITCATGSVCTEEKSVCVAGGTAACPGGASGGDCDACAADDIFQCVDRTHFSMCQNPDVYMECDAGEVCYSKLYSAVNELCFPESVLTALGVVPPCESSTTVSTTTEAIPTPSVDVAKALCTAALTSTVGVTVKPGARYFFTIAAGDSTCKTYIYCEPDSTSTVSDASVLNCKDKFYDNAKQSCVPTFVAGCNSSN